MAKEVREQRGFLADYKEFLKRNPGAKMQDLIAEQRRGYELKLNVNRGGINTYSTSTTTYGNGRCAYCGTRATTGTAACPNCGAPH